MNQFGFDLRSGFCMSPADVLGWRHLDCIVPLSFKRQQSMIKTQTLKRSDTSRSEQEVFYPVIS